MDGRQLRLEGGGHRDIVVADHGYVVGYPQSHVAHCRAHPKGQRVVGAEDCRGAVLLCQQLLRRRPGFLPVGVVHDGVPVNIAPQTGVRHRPAVALEALVAGIGGGSAADVADAGVAAFQKVARGLIGRLVVVDVDSGNVQFADGVVDQHQMTAFARDHLREIPRLLQTCGRHDDAVDLVGT